MAMTASTRPAGYSPSTACPADAVEGKAPAKQPMRYEYRIPRKLPHIVQVRPARRKGQPKAEWEVYMSCTSHADALRILSMLAEGESEREVVTR